MRSKSNILFIGLVALLLLVAPATALFGPPTAIYRGRINFLQPTNFTLISEENKMIRIMVARDRTIPPEVQLGVLVEVRAVLGNDQQWYLDKFEKIQLQPNQ